MISFFVSVFFSARKKAQKSNELIALEGIYRKYGYILERRCRRLLKDSSLVEDAMQEVMIAIARSYKNYRGSSEEILPWLYRITTTHSLRILEKNGRWSRNIEQFFSFQQSHEAHAAAPLMEEKMSLEQLLRTLDEEQKQAILFYFVSGMTQEEIADVMQVKRDKVRGWLKDFKITGQSFFRRGESS